TGYSEMVNGAWVRMRSRLGPAPRQMLPSGPSTSEGLPKLPGMGYPVMQEPSTTCGVGRENEGLLSGVLLANVAAEVGAGILETDVGSDTDGTGVVDVKVHVLAVSVAG